MLLVFLEAAENKFDRIDGSITLDAQSVAKISSLVSWCFEPSHLIKGYNRVSWCFEPSHLIQDYDQVNWCFAPSQQQRVISGLVSWCFEPSQP